MKGQLACLQVLLLLQNKLLPALLVTSPGEHCEFLQVVQLEWGVWWGIVHGRWYL